MRACRISYLCSPNTVSGDCTLAKLQSLGDQLNNDLDVQVLVVAVNGINGGPESFNYQALASIATVRSNVKCFCKRTTVHL